MKKVTCTRFLIIHEDRYIYFQGLDKIMSQYIWTDDITKAFMFTTRDGAVSALKIIDAGLYDNSDRGSQPSSDVYMIEEARVSVELHDDRMYDLGSKQEVRYDTTCREL